MNGKTILFLGFIMLFFLFCSRKNNKKDIEEYKHKFSNDSFKNRGTYKWSFQLMGTKQTSIHTFFSDSILYKMKGKIYGTEYPMYKLSYNEKDKKWIGKDPKNTIYVLFFKEKTDSTVSIYKRKCKDKGIKEALNFTCPKPNATDDHGWNVYALAGYNMEDNLPILGNFFNQKTDIFISDKKIVINNKTIEKMSFHSGERRWVGKYNNQYLQVFFKSLSNLDSLQISVNWFSDLEKLYKTKYATTNNWQYYEQK